MPPKKDKARSTVETVGASDDGVCFRCEMVSCGNPRCKQCKDAPSHGPYWYAYAFIEQRTITAYVGVELDEDKGRRRIAKKARAMGLRRRASP